MSALISKFKKSYMFMVLVHFFPVVGDDVTCDVSKGSSRISVGGGKGGGYYAATNMGITDREITQSTFYETIIIISVIGLIKCTIINLQC